MTQYYELVVYTSQLPTYADPVLDRLDPNRMIQYRCAGAAQRKLGVGEGGRGGGRGWAVALRGPLTERGG